MPPASYAKPNGAVERPDLENLTGNCRNVLRSLERLSGVIPVVLPAISSKRTAHKYFGGHRIFATGSREEPTHERAPHGAEPFHVRKFDIIAPPTITKTSVADQTKFEEAYKRVEPELIALSSDDLVPINLEIASAVATVLFLWAGILKLRDSIVRELVGFDIVRFDKIEDYAMALGHANTMHLIAAQPPDTLYTDTMALIRRGFVKEASIKELKGSIGYKNIAIDLQILATVLKAIWPTIEGKCGIQLSELDHALKLSTVMFSIVGFRENGSGAQVATADMRARAYTLFTRAYDDARRAIIFLRWHEGDADTIAPSLHPGRSASKKKPADEPSATPPAWHCHWSHCAQTCNAPARKSAANAPAHRPRRPCCRQCAGRESAAW